MERHLDENQLALYVDGMRLHRLDSVPGELRAHVQDCSECKQAVMEIAAAVPQEVYQKGEAHPYFDRKAVRWVRKLDPVLKRAAVVTLLIGTGGVTYYIVSHRAPGKAPASQVQVQPPAASPRQPTGTETVPAPALAAADPFRPAPLYERLTTERLRSTGIVRHQPSNGDTISARQLFNWKGGNRSEGSALTILDNRGREIVHADINGQTYQLASRLPKGLFYWKVEQAGELLFVGRFYVVE